MRLRRQLPANAGPCSAAADMAAKLAVPSAIKAMVGPMKW